MNRVDFMNQLERLLQNIASTEREEAIQYYNDYFDDAGTENEQAVIEALGSPARVAENIKKELLGAGGDNMPKTVKASDRILVEYGKSVQGEQSSRATQGSQGTQSAESARNTYSGESAFHTPTVYADPVKDKRMPAWLIAMVATILILMSPAILGVVTGVIGVLCGGLVAWFALIVGFGVAALGLFIAFGVLIVTGIICLYTSPWVGVAMLGGGLICGCMGILFLMLTVAMAGIVTPAVFRGIRGIFRFFFKKRTKA